MTASTPPPVVAPAPPHYVGATDPGFGLTLPYTGPIPTRNPPSVTVYLHHATAVLP